MQWTDFLDAIYCISLPESKERRQLFRDEMKKYDIPFSIWPAIKKDNGAKGLRATFIDIFTIAVQNDFNNVLIFEDDAIVVCPDINEVMNKVINQLPKWYDMVYLGINAFGGFHYFHSENLLKVKAGCTTHAVMYSKKFMEKVLAEPIKAPIDMHFTEFHKDGRAFATYPLLYSQRTGFSYIENKDVNYSKLIQERFEEKVKQL